MYKSSGSSIKACAYLFCIIDIILAFFIAYYAYKITDNAMRWGSSDSSLPAIIAFIVFCVSALIAWLTYLLLAGFGELVENSAITVEEVKKLSSQASPSSDTPPSTDTTRRPSACPQCREPLEGGEKFCARCGFKLKL